MVRPRRRILIDRWPQNVMTLRVINIDETMDPLCTMYQRLVLRLSLRPSDNPENLLRRKLRQYSQPEKTFR